MSNSKTAFVLARIDYGFCFYEGDTPSVEVEVFASEENLRARYPDAEKNYDYYEKEIIE